MTNKVELNRLSQVNNNEQNFLTALNENLTRLQAAINDTLSRSGVAPNQMEEVLDMNGNRICNVGPAVEPTDVVTKQDIQNIIDAANEAIANIDGLVEAAKVALENYAREYIYPTAQAALDGAVAAQHAAEDARDALILNPGYQAVVANINKLVQLADDLSNIDTLVADLANVDTVAGNISDISTVAGISSAVSTLAGIASEITAVQAKLTEIEGVYNNLTDIATVAGVTSDITAVAGALSDIQAVEAALTDIGTVATNISDVLAVAADMTTLLAVGADLTNLDALAADLTNLDSIAANLTEILNASTYASQAASSASNASIWAEGTDAQVSALGGTHSAKVWTEIVQQIVANTRIFGGTVDASTGLATLTSAAKVKLGTTADTITLTNDTTAITGYAANEGIEYVVSVDGTFAGLDLTEEDLLWSTGTAWHKIESGGGAVYTAGTGISIDNNNVISNTGLINTATGTNSLTVLGTATSKSGSVNVGADSVASGANTVAMGYDSKAQSSGGIAIGTHSTVAASDSIAIGGGTSSNVAASATGTSSIAVGVLAKTSAPYTIQLGKGTNSTSNTMNVGLSQSLNVQLLNSSGKVPTDRYIPLTGATASTAGATGSVPAPAAGDNEKFLRGDGTWAQAGSVTYEAGDGIDITHRAADQENFTRLGSPTITNKVVSNISETNHLTIPALIGDSCSTFEVTSVITRTSSTAYECCFSSGGNVQLFKYTSGTSFGTWVKGVSDQVTSGRNSINTTYWVKAVLSTSNYKCYCYPFTEGTEPPTSLSSWNLCCTIIDPTALTKLKNMFSETVYITGNADTTYAAQYWHGSINLNYTNIYIDGELKWTPYTTDAYIISNTGDYSVGTTDPTSSLKKSLGNRYLNSTDGTTFVCTQEYAVPTYTTNYAIAGTVNVTDDYVATFNSGSYIVPSQNWTYSGSPWAVEMKFKTPISYVSGNGVCLFRWGNTTDCMIFLNSSGYIVACGWSSGSQPRAAVSLNTTYWLRVEYDGSQINLYLSTTGTFPSTPTASSTSPAYWPDNNIVCYIGSKTGSETYNSSIDLKEVKWYSNGALVWEAVTQTGGQDVEWTELQNKLTAGDGIDISSNVISAEEMVGADGVNIGKAGAVPRPAATDNTKFLRGDGTWSEAASYDDTTGTVEL